MSGVPTTPTASARLPFRLAPAFVARFAPQVAEKLGQVVAIGKDGVDREPALGLQHPQESLDIVFHLFLPRPDVAQATPAADQQVLPYAATLANTMSASGVYSNPKASATPGCVICPFNTLTPRASSGVAATAPASPRSASSKPYGSVAFASPIVLVRGTAPGMFVTQ